MVISEIFIIAAVSVFGASVGSFLNVCIYRIPASKSIALPGSFCPVCKYSIPFYLNIPILSYIILLGKCKSCHTPISIRYPIVETITAMFAAATFLKFGLTVEALFWFAFISVLIVISFIDIDLQIIPDILSIPGIFIFALSPLIVESMSLKDSLLGILFGGGSLYLVAVTYYFIRKDEGMGGGDIKLLAMIGAAIGWKGVAFTIFCSSLLGTLAGAFIMVATKKADAKLRIPFGPYLAAASVIYIFKGEAIINWYFGILS
ncbi:MAG: prepilin peptidase [Desulfamplus sp.]|nr:prepilin peptidase [Desulfamplus sp.]MBF0388945.1 prepilin peptidase [Desulfamplus sp.]